MSHELQEEEPSKYNTQAELWSCNPDTTIIVTRIIEETRKTSFIYSVLDVLKSWIQLSDYASAHVHFYVDVSIL